MINDERVLSLADVPARLSGPYGRRVHPSTVWRWARRGIDGNKLEVRRLGRRLVTSFEAIERFAAALAGIEPGRRRACNKANLPSPRHVERRSTR